MCVDIVGDGLLGENKLCLQPAQSCVFKLYYSISFSNERSGESWYDRVAGIWSQLVASGAAPWSMWRCCS